MKQFYQSKKIKTKILKTEQTIYSRKNGKIRVENRYLVKKELYIFFKQFKIQIHKSLNISGKKGIEYF